MATRISALVSPEFLAVLSAMQGADREAQAQIRKAAKAMAQPEWQAAVARNAKTKQEVRVLSDTARATVSNQNVSLKSASVGRRLSGGAKPVDIAKSVEFGSGKRQFKERRKSGYVVYQAAAKIIPRIAALYVQTVARTLHEAAEGKK